MITVTMRCNAALLYFNCVHCGKPFPAKTESEMSMYMQAGTCGCTYEEPMKINEQTVYQYFFNAFERGVQPPSLREVADDLGVSHSTVREYILKLEVLGRMVRRSRKYHVVKNGKVLITKFAKNDETSNEKKSRGGRAAAAVLRERAERMGLPYSGLGSVPSGDEARIQENIKRIVERNQGEGKGLRQEFVTGKCVQVG